MGSVLAGFYIQAFAFNVHIWLVSDREPRLSQGIPLEDFDTHALYSLKNMTGTPVFAAFSGTVPVSMLCSSQYKVLLNSPLSPEVIAPVSGVCKGRSVI